MSADAADLTMRQVMFAFPFAATISIVSHRLRFLTAGGAITQFALGWFLLGIGGWAWTVPILLFFVSCSSKTVKIRGISWVDNDVVNLAASLVGAAVSYCVRTLSP